MLAQVRKSSYYVWFLGAKESKGLRGEEYILPVVRWGFKNKQETTNNHAKVVRGGAFI